MKAMEVETPFGMLRPTISAGRRICNQFGSYMEALRKIELLDQNAFFAVIAAGLNKKVAEIEDDVFAHGLPDLVTPVTDYITLLANGGKPIKSDGEGNKKGE